LGVVGGGGEGSGGFVGVGGDRLGRDGEQGLRALDGDEEADRPRKAGSAVIFAGEADGDADREEEAEVGEDRLARAGDEGDVEQVRLAEAEKEAGGGKHRDRQHQRAAQGLQAVERKSHAAVPIVSIRARTSRGESRSSARAAASRQASTVTRRSAALTAAMAAGATDSSCTPSPTRSAAPAGMEARPPHAPIGRPWRPAASAAARIRRRTAGWKASTSPATIGLPRSMARTYWLRSLEPIEKKSASAASRSASIAAAGVSIITPNSALPPRPLSTARTAWSSEREATMGSMILQGPGCSTARMARSCSSRSSGRHRVVRTPRRPSAGLSSG